MQKSYAKWSSYDIDAALDQVEVDGKSKERQLQNDKDIVQQDIKVHTMAETFSVNVEIQSAQAAVAALKASRMKKTSKTNVIFDDDSMEKDNVIALQKQALTLKLKSQNIQDALLCRGKVATYLQKNEYAKAVAQVKEGLIILQHLKSSEEEEMLKKSLEEKKSCSRPETGCCSSHTPSKKKENDDRNVIAMIRTDLYIGKGKAYIGLQEYALATEAYKHVLLEHPKSIQAWLGRGKAFSKIGRKKKRLIQKKFKYHLHRVALTWLFTFQSSTYSCKYKTRGQLFSAAP